MGQLEFEQFVEQCRSHLEALFQSSGARRFSVPFEDFAKAAWLGVSGAASESPKTVPQLLIALCSDDLGLALGCVRGAEHAWETFWSTYRAALYEAARALVRDEAGARELADSLLTELYGVSGSAPERQSRLSYYHGRSSLKTWLRSVLYQKFIDEYRRQSRLATLPEEMIETPASARLVSEQDDFRYAQCLSQAVEAVLAELPAKRKLLLSYYYVHGLSLKQIGRLTGEHEATVSRHLESLRKRLRKQIEIHLRRVSKLSAFELDRCLDFASRGVSVSLERVLKTE